jgi:hypothetical protein
MKFDALEKIADAVLYEGYILYPYRPSSIKNQQRWNFGTLFPRQFAEAQKPVETCSFHAEVLVEGKAESLLTARLRFLQIVPAGSEEGWDEGFARARTLEPVRLAEMSGGLDRVLDLAEPAAEERERVPAQFRETPLTGKLTLRVEELRAGELRAGELRAGELSAGEFHSGLYRLSVSLANETPLAGPETMSRRDAQASAFTSAHLLLHIEGGAFVSLLDPPSAVQAEVAACRNQGVFPVVAGDEGDRSHVLCSPIILYDYPQIAPESAGDFFDGTEMDEMLALRVMTLTDEEKAEMRRSDPHARAILERTEMLPAEHLMKIHGAVREMRPVPQAETADAAEFDGVMESWDPFADRPPVDCVRVFGVDVRRGDRVRLWPQKRADIMDIAMEGKVAIIEAIEQDLEDNLQFAVVLEDDPGMDMGMLRQAGHRFFFTPDEVEPLGMELP